MVSQPIADRIKTARVPTWFAAAIEALQTSGGSLDALQAVTDSEWTALLEFSDLSHLTLPLARLDGAVFPAWVRDRLAKNSADNDLRFQRACATYCEAAQALQKAGVSHILIKGFTQSPMFVANARLRMQSDLDLYIPHAQISPAIAALQAIGYMPDGKNGLYENADHTPTLQRIGSWKWAGNFFDPAMPLSIEVHFCLWNEDRWLIAVPEVQRFWQRRAMRTVEGISFPSLDSIDHIAYFALHILRGAISGDWIVHHVLEMAHCLQAHAQNDQLWPEWERRYSTGFRELQAVAFCLAERWFACNLPIAARECVNHLPFARYLWIDRYGDSLLENMFKQNLDWVCLHLACLNSGENKMTVLRRSTIRSRIPRLDEIPLAINRRPTTGLSNRYLRYVAVLMKQAPIRTSRIARMVQRGLTLWFIAQLSRAMPIAIPLSRSSRGTKSAKSSTQKSQSGLPTAIGE